MQQKTLFLALLVSASLNSGCVTIKNARVCSVLGLVQDGMTCTETLTAKKTDIDAQAEVELLEPQPERDDPEHPGQLLPKRAGAMCMSAKDWNEMKTALETLCRQVGRECQYEIPPAMQVLADPTLVQHPPLH